MNILLIVPKCPIQLQSNEYNASTRSTSDLPSQQCVLRSETDEIIMHNDVEKHAGAAAAVGFKVRKVKFEDSPHCTHIREDEEKY